MKDVNVVVLLCRLTKDPELRSLPSGSSVCALRVAFTSSWKDSATGEYIDKPNYCDVTVWGSQGENCAKYLAKGRQICVYGRLQWREWSTNDGAKRQALDVVADQVQFLGGGEGGEGGGFAGGGSRQSSAPADTGGDRDFQPTQTPAASMDEDIPF